MKRKTLYYVVEAELPEDVSEQDFRAYIDEAIAAWGGSYWTEHPLFDRDDRRVHVRRGLRRKPR